MWWPSSLVSFAWWHPALCLQHYVTAEAHTAQPCVCVYLCVFVLVKGSVWLERNAHTHVEETQCHWKNKWIRLVKLHFSPSLCCHSFLSVLWFLHSSPKNQQQLIYLRIFTYLCCGCPVFRLFTPYYVLPTCIFHHQKKPLNGNWRKSCLFYHSLKVIIPIKQN